MKNSILYIFFMLMSFHSSRAQTLKEYEAKRITLPNRWGITPLGKSLPLGDLPLNIAVSTSEKLLAVTNNGQSEQSIMLFDAKSKVRLDSCTMGKSWYGLTFANNDKDLYASGGHDNWIVRFDVSKRKLTPVDTFRLGKPWPVGISVAGICVDDQSGILYTVTKEDNSLYLFDVVRKEIIQKVALGGEAYACMLSKDRKTLFISCWGCDRLILFDTKSWKIKSQIVVGDNPNEICLSKDGKFVFVANANDNSVSVIDVASEKVIETLNAALYPKAPSGSTSNSLALSKNGKTLYIANADNNCLAVFDVSEPGRSKSKGFIPTGWYPTSVRVVGNTLFVANGKGFSSFPNPNGPNPGRKKQEVLYQKSGDQKVEKVQYIGGLFRGTMSVIPVPDEKTQSVYSQLVYRNSPYSKELENTAEGEAGNPIPRRVGDSSPIKHVFYIIKENRTYDQVLSDVPGGNGDTSLLLFGEKVTPNQHALVKQFVLLDNFYVDGEVSADGHNWSTGAYATDFLEKNWPSSYGGRGGHYNAEGTRNVANNKGGFIWDLCSRNGVSFRTYGEFADDGKPNIPVLKDHFCTYYTGWDESVKDTVRFYQWRREFDSLLAVGKVPQLNTLRFVNDHTEGLRKGVITPSAHVADNDLAVGLFVEHLSKSSIWNESVVFILEDDAQNGPDHVDAHRSTAYVAGGMVKRGFIDHTMYSTSSVLRTIELILGMPPMTQYDAAATPLWRCFNQTADASPFKSLPSNLDLDEKNTAMNKWQKMSEEFNFAIEDRVPDAEFNEVLWYAIKGNPNVPAPVHAAFFAKVFEEEEEED